MLTPAHTAEQTSRDAQLSAQNFADITVHGIERVGDAFADMVTRGKLDLKSLERVGTEVISEINKEILRGWIRKGLRIPGATQGQLMAENPQLS